MSEKRPYYFVVYGVKVGRTEPGIYKRQVTFDGDLAFVHPKEDAKTADIIPRANVFAEKKDAEAYIAGTGVLRWCVKTDGRKGVPEMFQARVRYHVVERYSGRNWPNTLTAIRVDNNETISDYWGFKAFATKKEAETVYRWHWKQKMKEVRKELAEWTDHLQKLEANKPRSGKKAQA